MSTIVVVATVRESYNGYVLERTEHTYPNTLTIADAEQIFKALGHELLSKYRNTSDLECRVQVWGQNMYWSY